ncbi:tripartite tricarboxylate transporter substrate binding protein [Puniceibacterium sp. IMCC21224]|uniref:Bug family tripartite tricarboxylate transporter substrate binding protein n=1 Tax=Puniceibacterium sp. IMCC21224 TaxID=1618204 RepID=UPI00065D1910|nr:tripartite tricarboxylate transporter substrate-binding protein [Puniceibacterium sp. IMCC21224]KMK65162.1 hypothetical protein IMCC21224_12407 [Puniceibacterium sp. IMCC21224]
MLFGLSGKIFGLAVALAVGSGVAAQAQSVEEFYSDNTLTMIVSAGPGGASDFFGRQFAPYLSKHLPGNPDIIVMNQPGASGMQAALLLQERGPFDGSTIALLQRNNFYVPIIDEKVKFRPREMHWLGSLNKEFYTVIARTDSPVQTSEDLLTTPLILGATSFNNENRTFAAMMNEIIGTQFDIVTGYDGNAAVGLALERNEVQSRMQTVNSLQSGEAGVMLDEGKINIIAQIGMESASQYPDLKNMIDYVADPEDLAYASFMLSPLAAGRPFAAPAGVPEDRLAALRAAFDAAAADPEFVAEMARLKSDLEPINGDAVQKIVNDLWDTPAPVLEKVKALLTPPK